MFYPNSKQWVFNTGFNVNILPSRFLYGIDALLLKPPITNDYVAVSASPPRTTGRRATDIAVP